VDVDGVLLDIDGVLVTSWQPLPGATETLSWLREHAIPIRLITNTTTHGRASLASALAGSGLEVTPEEVLTAVVATASYLRSHHPGARVALLSDGDARSDLRGIELVDPDADADVVVVGGASEDFTYPAVNALFRNLMTGAALVAMHRNHYWRTDHGLQLDAGAYVSGLEAASGVEATICGKPSPAFFDAAVDDLRLPRERVAMVGDDVRNDVLGAQAVGIAGVLVRTGKFRPADLDRADGSPQHVIDSIANLPALLEAG
jgi:HAD superfamily hydrolase (TIGR01458 family)